MAEYAELHAHSNYSFQEGASFVEELVLRAKELGYRALALTDHDNLCGAMEFARVARSIDLPSITGAEVTLRGGHHLTLLASSPKGYSNLSRLISLAHLGADRRYPTLNPTLLPEYGAGLIVLSGCAQGPIPQALTTGHPAEALALAKQCVEWFGQGNFYLELQQNLVYGDSQRNKRLLALGEELGIPVVATNNVHYHTQERHRLQDCLVSIRHNKSMEETHRERRANTEFYLKSPQEMERLFREYPEAIRNTLKIAERCSFDLSRDLTYQFPDSPVPGGFTQLSYLEHLCRKAAIRRYGRIDGRVETRLQEELRLIERHHLAGFFLIYHDIIQLAREVQVDLGLVDPEIPIEEVPPGRGRGSSVAMIVGYLMGLSHIDPLQFNLSLERFLPDEDLPAAPDIDLDFPRNIREELIKRVHQKWGWDHAALSGMISTYQIKGAIRDLGKALGLPIDEVDKLAKRVEHAPASGLRSEMLALPEFRHRVDAPVWRDLIDLSAQLDGFPKYLAQHPGGMIISSTPLIDQVPVQQSAIDGRYICHWDKDSIDDAGFVKIDFLSLGALSQMHEAVQLIEQRTGKPCDLSRIDFEDTLVYDMLARADTIGIFQVESAAQMQTITRIRPRNLTDMAHEVGAVRPGVGVNDGVSTYIRRRMGQEQIRFDHPLEKRALERTLGVILFQDQMNQVAMDVGGFSAVDADQLRRAFGKRKNAELIKAYWERFREGAGAQGVDEATACRIFGRMNGHYMFPESHAFAFGVTAYQASWLKCYYPLEFFVGLFNEQPMGFYNLETLKEDAKRHEVRILHPDINRSTERCVIEDEAIRLGLVHVRGVGQTAAEAVVRQRAAGGPYQSIAEFMERTGLQQKALDNLTDAGALDSLRQNRRDTRWEVGLRYHPVGSQMALPMPVNQDMAELPKQTAWERMEQEYRTIGLHPEGHVMAYLRPQLKGVTASIDVLSLEDGALVRTAGLVIRRQRPLAKAVFITLEDEFGHIPLMVFPRVYERYRHILREPFLLVEGRVSRRDGTMNIHVTNAEPISATAAAPKAKNWG
jgi:error-prone DNA polymerase